MKESPNILSDIAHPLENRIDPILNRAQERVRELELELAQTKLAHVEAECRNQVWKCILCCQIFSKGRKKNILKFFMIFKTFLFDGNSNFYKRKIRTLSVSYCILGTKSIFLTGPDTSVARGCCWIECSSKQLAMA